MKPQGYCHYCKDEPATVFDHLITKNQMRRNVNAQRERENPRYKVPSCDPCNLAKYTLLRVPVGYPYKVELEALTNCVYGVFSGKASELRGVLPR